MLSGARITDEARQQRSGCWRRAPDRPWPNVKTRQTIRCSTTPTPGCAHAELAKEIRRHDRLYYDRDAPELSDAAYDELRRELERLEAASPELITPDSPTQSVGAAPSSGFRKVRHAAPMLSLGNAMDDEEVRDFFDRVRRFLKLPEAEEIAVIAEPKIDGLSCSLRYEQRKLVLARHARRRGGGRGHHRQRRQNRRYSAETARGAPDCSKCAARFICAATIS